LKYRAAELMAAAGACDPARWLANIRLMSAEVPLLPLKACDRPCDPKPTSTATTNAPAASITTPTGSPGAVRLVDVGATHRVRAVLG